MPTSRTPSKRKLSKVRQDRPDFFKKIADLTPDLLFVFDLKSLEIIYVNQQAGQLTGEDAVNIYDKGPEIFKNLLHPDDYGRFMVNLETYRNQTEHEITEAEVRFKLAEGSWNWFRVKNEVFKQDAKGAFLQTICIARNVQEQKTANEKLQEEHRRFKNAQAIGHIGSFELDLPEERLVCSEEFYRIHGLDPKTEEFNFQQLLSLVHPDDKESFLLAVKNSHATGEPLNEVNRIIRPDGSIRHVHRRAEIIQDPPGNSIRLYGTIQDITEQTEAQKKIKHNEALMRRAEEVGHFGSYEFHLRNGQLSLSDGFYRLFGYEPQGFEASAEFIDAVSVPEDTLRVHKILEQATLDKQPYVYQRRIYNKNGQMRCLRSNGKVICDAAGNAIKLLGIVEDITERKKSEEKLKEEHRRLNEAQAIGHIGSFEWVKNKDHLYWSDEMYRIQGLEPQSEKITLERVLNFVHPEDRALVKSQVKQGWEKAGQGEFVYRILKQDGELRYVLGRFESFANKEGKVTHINGTAQDITEQKKAEQELMKAYTELERSNTTISRMLEGSLAAIVLLDPLYNEEGTIKDFIFKGVNKAAEDIKHVTEAELLGRGLLEKFPAAHHLLFDALLKVMKTGETIRMERHYHKQLPASWVDVSATRNGNGIILTFIDITDRKKAEEQLEENALFIRKVADTTPDILFVFNQEKMRLRYTNRSLFPLFGTNPDPLQVLDPKELLSLVHPDDKKDASAYLKDIAETADEKPKEVSFRLQNLQGEWRWFHCRGRVFKRSAEGKALEHLFIMRDITEEKNITKALLEAEELSVKGTMARTIAHEVRVPAANISLSMEMIQKELGEKLTENEEAMIFFNIVNKSCRRISDFINDLISISITEPDAFSETDLGILTEEVLNEAQDRIFLKGVQTERHFDKGYIIKADRERLRIALLNIVMNAVEAMEDQKGLLQIFIRNQEGKVQITIHDNGTGMTEEQLSKMFDVYYTSKPDGMGVGLANVQAILKDHSANVKVKSKPGKGTAFNIVFKRVR